MKFLVIGSKSDPASRNILMNLMEFREVDYYAIDGDMLKTENLDKSKIAQYDLIIFASKHQSKEHKKTLSIHSPGNFKEVWGGGEPGTLSLSSALFNKFLFEKLTNHAIEMELKYQVTLEATHHGPLIDKPSVFIEIGSTETEWKDRRASFCIAKTIIDTVKNFKTNEYREIAIGIGGSHYCPSFNKIQKKSNIALSHIIPKYMSPISEQMILESINKTAEEVDFAILDWKGLGKADFRDSVIKMLEKNYINWKKVSEIKK
jgi:D-aminoacyl-tRNA deacylase